MREMSAPAGEWADAVSDAARHAEARMDAQAVAEPSRSPISRDVLTTLASFVLLALLATNTWLALRPATSSDPLFYVRANRAWTVADAADVIEDFRLAQGRLPTADEVADDLGSYVSYEPRRDGYVVAVSAEGASIEYDSSVPLEDWLASMTGGSGT